MLSLPRNDRALLTTYWLSSATAETIADEVGCSVITVRRRLSRAQARFERLARRDPALARRMDDARLWLRFRRSAARTLAPPALSEPARGPASVRELVA